MWKFEYTAEAPVSPSVVWARYLEPSTWVEWYPDIKSVSVDGPFENGSTGLLTQDPELGHFPEPVPFTLTDVVEDKSWALQLMAPTSETGIQDQIAMRSYARLEQTEGGVRITHAAELSGPGSEEIGKALGEMIGKSVTSGVETLVTLVSA